MQLKPEEISKVIRSQIKYYDNAIKQNETGTVLMVGDGIARASGLINCMAGELLEFEDGASEWRRTWKKTVSPSSCLVMMKASRRAVPSSATGKVVSVPVGEGMIGRVVNALGQPIDGKPIELRLPRHESRPRPAPGRQPVKQPLQTGIKAIDSMIPIGRGQP